MTQVYVASFFKNPGWGTRLDNYDRLVDVDVFESHALALEAAEKHVGVSPGVGQSRRGGTTYVERNGWSAKIEARVVKTKAKHPTIKNINAALKAAGIDAEIVRGKGYFYFTGPAMDLAKEQGVYGVARLGDLPIERWVEEAKAKIS